jgi:uncharacterized protein DUF6875
MSATATNLYLLQDLDDVSRTGELSERDRGALRAVADWINAFVVQPHKDLGRAGTVCPYVPVSLQREVLWLAPEQIEGREESEVVELVDSYRRLLLETRREGSDEDDYKVIVVVFTDLPPDRAGGVFGNVQQQLAASSYEGDRILYGPYYEGNDATALYNPKFRPFQSPVPFLFVRHGVIGDWKFFLDDNKEFLSIWGRRYGESAVQELGDELRRTNWRQLG